MCCTIGTSGGDGGGLYAEIHGSDVSNSSMSLTTVTATNNTAASTMHWMLLQQRDLWVVPVDSEWLCVCVRDGGLWAVCEQHCVSRPHC
jgi:hypothetical protein